METEKNSIAFVMMNTFTFWLANSSHCRPNRKHVIDYDIFSNMDFFSRGEHILC